MVKPSGLGSSVGMTLAHAPAERAAALDEAFRFDDVALVERYLAGARDLEVAVIGNEPDRSSCTARARSCPATSSTTTRRSTRPACRERRPPPRSRRRSRSMLKLARDTYRACGCEGFARVDFLLAGDVLVISEINTIPGFTPISLFPTMPASGGYDFGGVCRRVVDLALERTPRASATASPPPTCRADDGRPSPAPQAVDGRPARRAVALRPGARPAADPPDEARQARLGRASRRSAPARRSRCSSRRRPLRRDRLVRRCSSRARRP